jgi:hypothetical protein
MRGTGDVAMVAVARAAGHTPDIVPGTTTRPLFRRETSDLRSHSK